MIELTGWQRYLEIEKSIISSPKTWDRIKKAFKALLRMKGGVYERSIGKGKS